MKTGAVVAIAGVGVVVVGVLAWRARGLASSIGDSVEDVLQSVNPLNNDNIIYRGVNAITGGENGPDGQPLGARIWEWWHGDEFADWTPPAEPSPPEWSTGGGRWNNPSAYTAPGITGEGGAAFGIYPAP